MAAYGTDVGFEDWLESMGFELPADAPDVAILRARGSAYLDGVYESLWCGHRVDGAMQELGWPRIGAFMNCITPIPADAIPPAVINAAYRAGWLIANNASAFDVTSTTGQRVSKEKVDVLEVGYFDDGPTEIGGGKVAALDGAIDGSMSAFVCEDEGMYGIWSVGGGCC